MYKFEDKGLEEGFPAGTYLPTIGSFLASWGCVLCLVVTFAYAGKTLSWTYGYLTTAD